MDFIILVVGWKEQKRVQSFVGLVCISQTEPHVKTGQAVMVARQ